ncbi:MAG: hypothetical protein AABY22_16390 [Nanoarchaeota archaeon]
MEFVWENWTKFIILGPSFVFFVKETGDIDIKTIFQVMVSYYDPCLTLEQNDKFLNDKY